MMATDSIGVVMALRGVDSLCFEPAYECRLRTLK
jgi:hypothetical protein